MAEKYDSKLAAEFVMRCFHARTAAHVLHLKSTGPGSFAEHKALNEFYDGIVDLIDGFAEMYQGEYLELLPMSGMSGYQTPTSAMALISGMTKWIKSNREQICDSSECQNVVDEILSLCHSTAYKLKFLK
jgi:DNA-binding ferritin-like protein